MSAIAGWIDFQRDLEREATVVRAMTDALASRGPDAGGVWIARHAALGHRRLTVLDASGGQQPFIAGDVTATLAGRIYNAADLRRELGGEFRTRSDVETLARAYLRWGAACVERIDGAFAFALWDGRSRELHLARDRFGIKPLYTFAYPGGLLLASEPKGIMANPLFTARLDLAKLTILLQPRLAMPGEAPLVGLREVEPAQIATFAASGLSARHYWQLTSVPHEDSFEATVRNVRDLMESTVASELVSDEPIAAMLSGGVDSTSVAALATRSRGSLETFCIKFDTDSAHFVATELRPDIDAPYAAAAAEFLGARHHTLTVSMHDLTGVIPATRRARDLPGWGQFDASMYLLFREMSGYCKVALTGEAADEIFGGYPYCFNRELIERQAFPWLGNGPRLASYLSGDVLLEVDQHEDEKARYSALLARVPRLAGEDPENARMREVLYFGMAGPLSVILDRKDRMSANCGVEVRVPYLDHRLVEYVWNVPWSMKSHGGVKGLLKAAMGNTLPASTIERKKSAYPHIQSPEHDRALFDEALRIADDPRSRVAPLFDMPRLKGFIHELAGAGGYARRMLPGGASPAYMLINFIELEHWLASYEVALC